MKEFWFKSKGSYDMDNLMVFLNERVGEEKRMVSSSERKMRKEWITHDLERWLLRKGEIRIKELRWRNDLLGYILSQLIRKLKPKIVGKEICEVSLETREANMEIIRDERACGDDREDIDAEAMVVRPNERHQHLKTAFDRSRLVWRSLIKYPLLKQGWGSGTL
jgi:hypothetical protein